MPIKKLRSLINPNAAGSTADQVRLALKDALASVPAPAAGRGGAVRVAAGGWTIDRPIDLVPGVAMLGDGPGRSWVGYGPNIMGPVFRAGIKMTAFDGAAHTASLGTIAGAARYAWKSNGDAHVVFGGSPMQAGPYPGGWPSTSQATLEILTDGPLPNGFCTGSSAKSAARPIIVASRTADLAVKVGLAVALDAAETSVTATFPPVAGLPAGEHEIVVQVDTALTPPIQCWVDKVKQTPLTMGTVTAGAKLAHNRDTPWRIGVGSERGSDIAGDYFGISTLTTWTIKGMRLFGTARYSTASALTRRDAAALSATRFYDGNEAGMVAWLPMLDTPADAGERLARCKSDNVNAVTGCGLWASPEHASPSSATGPFSLRGLTLSAYRTGVRCGEALNLGLAMDVDVDDCELIGGAYAISTWNWGLAYQTRLRNLRVAAPVGVGIYSYLGKTDATDLRFGTVGRSCVVNRIGELRGKNWFIPYGTAGVTQSFFENWAGGMLELDRFDVDQESGDLAGVPLLVAEAAAGNGKSIQRGAVHLSGANLGQFGPGTAPIRLTDGGSAGGKAYFYMEGLRDVVASGTYPGLVKKAACWQADFGQMPTLSCPLIDPASS